MNYSDLLTWRQKLHSTNILKDTSFIIGLCKHFVKGRNLKLKFELPDFKIHLQA